MPNTILGAGKTGSKMNMVHALRGWGRYRSLKYPGLDGEAFAVVPHQAGSERKAWETWKGMGLHLLMDL